MTIEFDIRPIEVRDSGQVLTLQRAAFVQEALIYRDPDMPALTQSLKELESELADNLGCVALVGERVVGAARARASADVLLVGRVAIAPDMQGEGLGSALLEAVEGRGRANGCRVAELFTGSLSEANLRLYTKLGYRESERVEQGGGIAEIYLRKEL
jgi:GNAT superfamily N-acetyltransferase